MGHGGTLQMAGHGSTVGRRTANKKLTKLLTITKALTKTTNCTFRAKKVERHDQKQFFSGALRRIGAVPLSNSFRRNCSKIH